MSVVYEASELRRMGDELFKSADALRDSTELEDIIGRGIFTAVAVLAAALAHDLEDAVMS